MVEKIAKITKADGYRCAPEGHTTITLPCGAVVTGKIAGWALADKAASAMFGKKNAGAAPENKGANK
jgi:hypothetical protein